MMPHKKLPHMVEVQDTVLDERCERIERYLSTLPNGAGAGDIKAALSISELVWSKTIKRLAARGLVECPGPGRNHRYRRLA